MKDLLTVVFLSGAVLAGSGLAVQAGLNAQLRIWLNHPVMAALISFMVGTLALFATALALGAARPRAAALVAVPWWVWLGGVLGAYFVFATIVIAPRIGPALFFGLLVSGQLVASLVLEHYGLLGFAIHPVSVGRVCGALLLVAGVALLRAF